MGRENKDRDTTISNRNGYDIFFNLCLPDHRIYETVNLLYGTIITNPNC